MIEVVTSNNNSEPFKKLAEEIKRVNHQTEVLYTCDEVHSITMKIGKFGLKARDWFFVGGLKGGLKDPLNKVIIRKFQVKIP